MSNPDAGRARGRAWLPGLVALLALGLGGSLFWLMGGEGGRSPRPAPAAGPGPADSAHDPGVPLVVPESVRSETSTPAGLPDELDPFTTARTSARTAPARFEGRFGTLRGHVSVAGGEPMPLEWRLQMRPSRIAPAREFARARTLEFADGRQEFATKDVPLGGYDIFPEAEGFNGQVLSLVLEPGNEHPFVNLLLVPAGTLEGRVLVFDGNPAAGLWVTLFAVTDSSAREAITDDLGLYRFEALPDGPYELMLGRASAPLLRERRPLRFLAPHLTFPDIELPQLGQINLRVVDSLAHPLEGVEVRGSGTNGGIVEGSTDYDGRLVIRHLPAGHFRMRLSHPSFEKKYERRIAVDVKVGETSEAPVRYGP